MSDPQPLDTLIIGAGPAGLQLGYYLQRDGRNYRILEAANAAGDFFKSFPRHRKLISSNKVYTGHDDPEINLRWDWNSLLTDRYKLPFREFSQRYFPDATTMVHYLTVFAMVYDLQISFQTRVNEVRREDDLFTVRTETGETFSARHVVIATGLKKPYLPPIPGIELTENYVDVTIDPHDFENQSVLVIGKGNSGFETADHLLETASVIHIASPTPVAMAWKTHFVGNLRAVNNNFLDTYQLKSQNAVIDATIERIERRDDGTFAVVFDYAHAGEETDELIYDRIISCTGFRFDDSIFHPSCAPELTLKDRFPAQTSAWESTNVEGLYFAGTLTQVRDFKKVTSGFIHGFRYNARCLHRILENRYHAVPFASRTLPATLEALSEATFARINRSSALWQQFGFLADVVVIDHRRGEARYYEELPVDFIHDSAFGREQDYYVITLEFGKVTGDPFHIERAPVPEHAESSVFLHPVVRHFCGDRELSKLHLLENLYGEWRDPQQHLSPFLNYLDNELAAPTPLVAD